MFIISGKVGFQDIVKLQSKVQTSVLGLGVDFVSPLSQQQEQQEQQQEPPPKSEGGVLEVWNLTHELLMTGVWH